MAEKATKTEKTTKATKAAKPEKIDKEVSAAKAAKPAVTKTAKPAKEASAVKTRKPANTVKETKAGKTTQAKKANAPVEDTVEISVRAMDLFDAFNQNKLPKHQAYIVSSFINANTGYAIYEVISYSAVKAIYLEGDGITFQSSGKKMHILIEPASYPNKAIEPYLREKSDQIPLRFKELSLHTAKNQIKIYMAMQPIESLSSFTVPRPKDFNIAFLFYDLPDVYKTMGLFFEHSFNKDAAVPQYDAKKAALESVTVIKKLMAFRSDFGN